MAALQQTVADTEAAEAQGVAVAAANQWTAAGIRPSEVEAAPAEAAARGTVEAQQAEAVVSHRHHSSRRWSWRNLQLKSQQA